MQISSALHLHHIYTTQHLHHIYSIYVRVQDEVQHVQLWAGVLCVPVLRVSAVRGPAPPRPPPLPARQPRPLHPAPRHPALPLPLGPPGHAVHQEAEQPGRGGGGGAGRGVSAVLAVRGAGEVVCAVLPPLSSPPDQMNLMTEEEGLGAGVLARLPTERSM